MTGVAHVDRWRGTDRIPAFGPFISRFELKDAGKLREFLSSQVTIETAGNGSGFTPARLLDFDGSSPGNLDPSLMAALDRALAIVSSACLSAAQSRRPLPDNTLLLAATWSFGRCPIDLQDEILKAAHAHLDAREHVFLENRAASTVILHGLGRIIKEEKRLERAIDLLLRHHPSKGNVPAALASLLSRPIATPAVLTEERVTKATKFVVALLSDLRQGQKFGANFNYALQIVGGILRCRQLRPYALLLATSSEAEEIHQQLASAIPLLQRRSTGSRQIHAKLGIVENLMDMLSGSGGDSHILINIEGLDADGDYTEI